MIWAQWGLKDRLVADPDIWLCHQCNDCSTRCPRGARPADVLAALRHESVHHHAVPGFLYTWVNQVKFLPLMLLISAVLIAMVLMLRGPLERALSIETHEHAFFADFFPHWLLIGSFSAFAGLAFLAAVIGVVRFWRGMKAADEASGRGTPVMGIVPATVRALTSIFRHDRFGKCTSHSSRKVAHLTAFYGFVALFVVTIWAVMDLYVFPLFGVDSLYPFNLMHPLKILANIGAVLLVFGCVKAISDRRAGRKDAAASTSFDWLFLWLLFGVAVTGVLTEIMRFSVGPTPAAGRGALEYVALGVYFVHLVLVFNVLVFLPFSKFAHIVYRTAAMVYAEYTGRTQERMETVNA
jgi:quinone-modifying oxidoreductase subunit QmoC